MKEEKKKVIKELEKDLLKYKNKIIEQEIQYSATLRKHPFHKIKQDKIVNDLKKENVIKIYGHTKLFELTYKEELYKFVSSLLYCMIELEMTKKRCIGIDQTLKDAFNKILFPTADNNFYYCQWSDLWYSIEDVDGIKWKLIRNYSYREKFIDEKYSLENPCTFRKAKYKLFFEIKAYIERTKLPYYDKLKKDEEEYSKIRMKEGDEKMKNIKKEKEDE